MKERNVFAVDAWKRNAGAHTGTKRPDFDETEEGLNDYEEEKNEQKRRITLWGGKQPPRLGGRNVRLNQQSAE